jgi:hypothetical protein
MVRSRGAGRIRWADRPLRFPLVQQPEYQLFQFGPPARNPASLLLEVLGNMVS